MQNCVCTVSFQNSVAFLIRIIPFLKHIYPNCWCLKSWEVISSSDPLSSILNFPQSLHQLFLNGALEFSPSISMSMDSHFCSHPCHVTFELGTSWARHPISTHPSHIGTVLYILGALKVPVDWYLEKWTISYANKPSVKASKLNIYTGKAKSITQKYSHSGIPFSSQNINHISIHNSMDENDNIYI